jgi:hypothetical protein
MMYRDLFIMLAIRWLEASDLIIDLCSLTQPVQLKASRTARRHVPLSIAVDTQVDATRFSATRVGPLSMLKLGTRQRLSVLHDRRQVINVSCICCTC